MPGDKKPFEIIDLSSYFNNDGISWDVNRTDGDLDGHGVTYPAEELPESNSVLTLHGIDFLFPEKSDEATNNLTLEDQIIPVPVNTYSNIYILGASEWGSFEEEVILQYADGDWEKVLLGLTDRCPASGRLLFGEKKAIVCTGRHTPDTYEQNPSISPDFGIWLQVLRANPCNELKTIQVGDNVCVHIFAMTLRLA